VHLTREQFEKHLAHMRQAENLIIDTEGTLTHPHSETWGLSYSSYGINEYFPFNHAFGDNLPQSWLPELRQVVEDAPVVTMHHAKHDLRALRNLGINRFGKKWYCTMNMAHMTDENRFTTELGPLSVSMGGNPKEMPPAMKIIIDGFGWHMVPVDLWIGYAGNDAAITEDPVFDTIYPDFVEQGYDGELWDWEQRWTEALCAIEDAGVLIDVNLAEQEYYRGTKIMDEMRSELGFNPGSPDQLGRFLIDELGLPVLKWTSGGKSGKRKPSFTKDVMEKYDVLLEQRGDKRAKQILRYRGWGKCTSSSYLPYIEKRSPVDGRLRTNYRQDRARTGRLTASVLHQIPKISTKEWNAHTKEAIITDDDRIAWEVDFRQLEFRTGALYATAMDPSGKTQRLIDIFNDSSRDIFDEMAAHNGITRDPMKTTAYLIQFGGGAGKLSESLNISELSAKGVISEYFRNYPGFARAASYAELRADQRGYVQYWSGRRRHFKFESEHHKAFNSLCQGGAFEIVKRQGTRVHEAGLNNEECRMDLTVHDSYRFSILKGKEDEYLPEIKRLMEDVVALSPDLSGVKFEVEINQWATKNKWVPKCA
jgi:DNA polymerase I-like protein with 3'-5' exonuclease and polymerase domains